MIRLDPKQLEVYLQQILGAEIKLVALRPLRDTVTTVADEETAARRALKRFGYGQPVLIEYRLQGEVRRVVLRTRAPNPYGYEYRADRAAGLLLDYDTFNELPRHIRALDVGALTAEGQLVSLKDTGEFYLLTEYAVGTPYAEDLQHLRDTGELTELDLERARALARYLVEIHHVQHDNPALYRRRIRDLVGSGEGIMGLTDGYPSDFPLADAKWLEQVEQACIAWRWRLKDKTHRLRQVHGDFHPFNVLFGTDTEFQLLDRSRGAWGEPGDDVSCMTVNYLFFSLQRSGQLDVPFAALWDTFWETYLEGTGDKEVLTVVAPFYAWRALVVASPVWYDVSDAVRRAMFRFIERVLAEEAFDPGRVNAYLA